MIAIEIAVIFDAFSLHIYFLIHIDPRNGNLEFGGLNHSRMGREGKKCGIEDFSAMTIIAYKEIDLQYPVLKRIILSRN